MLSAGGSVEDFASVSDDVAVRSGALLLDLGLVADLDLAVLLALAVVEEDVEVGHLSGQEEVLLGIDEHVTGTR